MTAEEIVKVLGPPTEQLVPPFDRSYQPEASCKASATRLFIYHVYGGFAGLVYLDEGRRVVCIQYLVAHTLRGPEKDDSATSVQESGTARE